MCACVCHGTQDVSPHARLTIISRTECMLLNGPSAPLVFVAEAGQVMYV